jgi:hypothetical protein
VRERKVHKEMEREGEKNIKRWREKGRKEHKKMEREKNGT